MSAAANNAAVPSTNTLGTPAASVSAFGNPAPTPSAFGNTHPYSAYRPVVSNLHSGKHQRQHLYQPFVSSNRSSFRHSSDPPNPLLHLYLLCLDSFPSARLLLLLPPSFPRRPSNLPYLCPPISATNRANHLSSAVAQNCLWALLEEAVFIMMRVYRLWDHKPTIRKMLPVMFVACVIGTLVVAVLAVLALMRTRFEAIPPQIMVCVVTGVPKTIPSALGILLLFNLLVILVSIYNALENPRRYEGEIFDSLRRDGSRVYLCVSLLWVLLLITSLVAEISVFFPIFMFTTSVIALICFTDLYNWTTDCARIRKSPFVRASPNVYHLRWPIIIRKVYAAYVNKLYYVRASVPNDNTAAATALILWDHCLTLDEELAAIWRSFKGQNLTKVIYIMNRHLTEVVMLYTTYIFTGWEGSTANEVKLGVSVILADSKRPPIHMFVVARPFSGYLPFTQPFWLAFYSFSLFITLRAYRLWDHRQTRHRVLLTVFVGCITGTFALSVITVLLLLRSRVQLPLSEDVCAVHLRVPKTLSFMMGIMLFFNLFVVWVTLYNALEIPHQSEHEVLHSLRRDGARLYLMVSFLWMLLLIASVTIEMRSFFSILMLVWALKANIAARMQLRIETLRFSVTADPVIIYAGQEGWHSGYI
ncbi:hypothetical protein IW262DRAFT_1521249 [Armillaria fumosa]|nr:hypothetical protein IW262DRAFT_1521249 [Armillaria fumosa]